MTITPADNPIPQKPLRLWPGVLIVVLQWLVRFVVPLVEPEAAGFAVLGGVFGGVDIIIWWVFVRRARWSERLGAIGLMIVALFATSRVVHVSIATGMMGLMLPIYAIPVLSLAFVVWAVASRRLPDRVRRASLVVTILLACGVWTLVRTGGFTGNLHHDFAWRWAKTPEQRLVAQTGHEPLAPAPPPGPTKTGPHLPPLHGPRPDSTIAG